MKNGWLRIEEQGPKELLSFFLCFLISLCFSMYFPLICLLNELKYLYVFVTRYFIHTINFPVEKFIQCYLLAVRQSSYWERVI
jgi:hypothetical protein